MAIIMGSAMREAPCARIILIFKSDFRADNLEPIFDAREQSIDRVASSIKTRVAVCNVVNGDC